MSIVFSSDQNGSDPNFVDFASRADLHATPSVWGQIASDADVGTLVLSHLSSIPPKPDDGELRGFAEKLSGIRSRYAGPLVIAEDLACISAGDD